MEKARRAMKEAIVIVIKSGWSRVSTDGSTGEFVVEVGGGVPANGR